MASELIGWVGAFILGLSLLQQLIGQGRDRGVLRRPPALSVGYLLATTGLCVSAALRREPVFVAAGGLGLAATCASLWIARRSRLRLRRRIPTGRSDVIPFPPRHLLLKRHGSNR